MNRRHFKFGTPVSTFTRFEVDWDETIKTGLNSKDHGYVYVLADKDAYMAIYVGMTIDPSGRQRSHRCKTRGLRMFILEESTIYWAYQKESEWIRFLHQLGHPLENKSGIKNPKARRRHCATCTCCAPIPVVNHALRPEKPPEPKIKRLPAWQRELIASAPLIQRRRWDSAGRPKSNGSAAE